MRRASALGIILILIGAAVTSREAAGQAGARPVDMTAPPAPVAQAVARADRAIQELQTTLLGRLKTALASGGPAAAVSVCRDEAQQLTTAIGAKHDLAIGRTSHRLRNPANAPRAWAAATVAAHAGGKVADAKPVVLDLGGRVGVLRPIGTLDFCVTCHGPRATVDAAIGGVLKGAYPQDQAVGFAPGDLRGWIWAEVRLD
jgi:hypothetical protein